MYLKDHNPSNVNSYFKVLVVLERTHKNDFPCQWTDLTERRANLYLKYCKSFWFSFQSTRATKMSHVSKFLRRFADLFRNSFDIWKTSAHNIKKQINCMQYKEGTCLLFCFCLSQSVLTKDKAMTNLEQLNSPSWWHVSNKAVFHW